MAIRVGPMIPGLGVNYTSPANTPRSNALNIRQTGATAGEASRFARIAPKGTTTKPPSPVSANTALGLGSVTKPMVPPSLSSTRAPSPQPTLIPANLDAAGRAGGANGIATTSTGAVVSTVGTPGNTGNAVIPELFPEQVSVAVGEQSPLPGEIGNDPGLPILDPDLGIGGDSSEPGLPDTDGGAGGGGAGAGDTGGGAGDTGGGAGDTGGGNTTPSPIDAAAALDAAIAQLLDPEFIAFQGDRASELRRLQNLRNQLFGDAEFGQTGSVQRQETLDSNARRRLAAQRAMSGMLQGGAYAGTERGLGTMQRANQDFAMQEMLRPFREATAADRLREFGLEYDPTSRVFDQADLDVTGFTTQTQAGREAAARARLAAIQQLAQQGITI